MVEPNSRYWPRYEVRKNTRVIKNCIDYKPSKKKFEIIKGQAGGFASDKVPEEAGKVEMLECKSLEDVLKDNQDILGEKDEEGRYGSKINFISMDIESYEAPLIGCTDWRKLLSKKPMIQLLMVETEHASSRGLRIIDASLSLASFAKVASLLNYARGYSDDVYERQNRNWVPFPHTTCLNASSTSCSFYFASKSHTTFDFKCDAT